MQRAPIVLTATAAGLAFTLGFNAHAKTPTTATAAAPSASTSASGTSGTPSAAPATSSSTRSSSSATKTATSNAVSTQYGNVQLKVMVADGKITGIDAIELPSNDPKSQQIGSYAAPLLRQSALAKQDGTVDAVSGATYTSNGYETALQSALDKAGFQVASTGTSG